MAGLIERPRRVKTADAAVCRHRRWLSVGRQRRWGSVCWLAAVLSMVGVRADPLSGQEILVEQWRARFAAEVDRRVDVPVEQQQRYVERLQGVLDEAGVADRSARSWVVVDRSAQVQLVFLAVSLTPDQWHWLGASLVSTGRPGSFDHFETPLGLYAHRLDNPDFRAEGTFNEHHIRGYGLRGMRVFDFGWVPAVRGWGAGGISPMRLQMHATDPDQLEPRLGATASKGCIRIAAGLNRFLDRHAVLDADYLSAMADGRVLWVMSAMEEPIPWPGRYLVVLDSGAVDRPEWLRGPGPALP